MARRCPVHDEVHEEGEPCPRLGQDTSPGAKDGDCERFRKPKEHEKKRVLADGGQWDDKRQMRVPGTGEEQKKEGEEEMETVPPKEGEEHK